MSSLVDQKKITYMGFHIPKDLLEHLIKHRPLISKECTRTERKYLFVQNKEVQGLYFDNESPGPKFRSITSSFSSACVGGGAVLTSRDWLSYYSHRVRESISTFSTRLLADRYVQLYIVPISVSRWRDSQSGPNSRGWVSKLRAIYLWRIDLDSFDVIKVKLEI